MARRIKFAATCYKCKARKGPGEAWLHRQGGEWLCHCDDCYRKANPKEAIQPVKPNPVQNNEKRC